MDALLFIGGLTAVAGGTLATLYYLVGSAQRETDKRSKRHPPKKHLLSHWR